MSNQGDGNAMLRHASAWYQDMHDRAEMEEVESYDKPQLVFTGSVLESYDRAVGKSKRGQYTRVNRALDRMGCIHKIQSGARSEQSRWILLREPSLRMWESIGGNEGLTSRTGDDTKKETVDSIAERVKTLEAAAANFEERLGVLESQTTRGEH
jgi:hypothetical protein